MPVISAEQREALAPTPRSDFSTEVQAFCEKHKIASYLAQAISLARQCFSNVDSLDVEMERDPETGDEWIVLRVAIRMAEVDAASARKRFSVEWVASVPWPQRHLICLSCHIL